ncbi:SPOR domain-containing protein [Pseudidiomarina taiwanensis]|uniref:Cell division protein FtsN n=1 Tax=Pseudidiomarina taiwanensis TaxID=337250 RepID=A0A432ZFD4_9GAMM|nr:SPOR domain-containing protein [Pseudidiomarina taiwanensis]RUO76677.1 cell division protein FtsN [Pseudidiomarina taiwanensis]
MDYANRGRPPQKKKPQKKRTSKSRAKAPARPAVPWWLVILAIVLVVALVLGLRFISGKGEQQAQQPSAQPLPQQQTTAEDSEALPEKPEERWQYIEELENFEVEVDVPERELGPPKLMQCGSFRREADAQTLKAQIAMVGLEAQVRATNGSNGLWYRVILGPYETKRDAERDRHKLQRAQVFGCQIWNWNL